jgi:hypothetical protein
MKGWMMVNKNYIHVKSSVRMMNVKEIEKIKSENKELKKCIKQMQDKHAFMIEIMEAATTTAGKYWLYCKLALSEYLTQGKGNNLTWMLNEYKNFTERIKTNKENENQQKE